MENTHKYKRFFENKQDYPNKLQYSNFDRVSKFVDNQNFVVPWQMKNTEEKKVLVK